MNFRIGLALWGYKDWVGELFPPKSRSTHFLKLYGQRFATVEGNTTFYSVPDAETVQRWVAETPPEFRFCPKLPRAITHQGELMPQMDTALAFLERMEGLGDRLGTIFAQLPPAYSPQQIEDLAAFVKAWPGDRAPLALEVRHLDWFREDFRLELTLLLSQTETGRVILDTRPIYDCPDDPQVASERKKPRLPVQPIATSNICLVRYISHPDPDLNIVYLQEWTAQVAIWLEQGKQVYFFVHCPLEERSPTNAQQVQTYLEKAGVDIPPLPWNTLEPPPSQLSLF